MYMRYDVVAVGKGAAVADELTSLFVGDLCSMAQKVQKKVPMPAG